MTHESESTMRLFSKRRRKDTIIISVILCVCCASTSYAQPASCREDSQCPDGFFCVQDSHFCDECLTCEQLKRSPPLIPTTCVKSISQCGPCIDGLMEIGDLNTECVSRQGQAEGEGASPYVWLAVAAGLLLLLVLVVLTIVYVLRNTDTFKVLTSTQTSVQSPCLASAPEQPPPYAACWPPAAPTYAPVPSSSPVPPHFQDAFDEECGAAAVKAGAEAGGGRGREAAGRQAARVFSPPAYVRAPFPPHDYEAEEANDNENPMLHNEDTAESQWTPDNSTLPDAIGNAAPPGGSAAGLSALSALVGEARRTTLVSPPPSKLLCVRQDTNNNGRSEAGEASGTLPAPAGPAVIINVVQSMNTIQQRNEL